MFIFEQFMGKLLAKPPPGNRSLEKTACPKAFQLVDVNYADPAYYKDYKAKKRKLTYC